MFCPYYKCSVHDRRKTYYQHTTCSHSRPHLYSVGMASGGGTNSSACYSFTKIVWPWITYIIELWLINERFSYSSHKSFKKKKIMTQNMQEPQETWEKPTVLCISPLPCVSGLCSAYVLKEHGIKLVFVKGRAVLLSVLMCLIITAPARE